MVRKRIFVSMRFFLICRADSKLDSPGMPISISTMSGRSSRAFSTASPPSAASPTTSKSLSLSSSLRTPWRNSVWSSTSKHLIFGIGGVLFFLVRSMSGIGRLGHGSLIHYLHGFTGRHVNFNARTLTFSGDHARSPAQHGNSFLDSRQPKRLVAGIGPRLYANSIVFHHHLHFAIFSHKMHSNVLGVGMLGNIVQRFLHHAINRLLGPRSQAANIF